MSSPRCQVPPKSDQAPGDPVKWFTRHLRGKRTDLSALVQPTFAAWLFYQRERFLRARQAVLANPETRDTPGTVSLAAHYLNTAAACEELLTYLGETMPRVRWLEAVAATAVDPESQAAAVCAMADGVDGSNLPGEV